MGLIRYSCGHILGHHEPIHVKFGVWRFFIMLYRKYEEKKSWKCWNAKQIYLMRSHFGTLFHAYVVNNRLPHDDHKTCFRFVWKWHHLRHAKKIPVIEIELKEELNEMTFDPDLLPLLVCRNIPVFIFDLPTNLHHHWTFISEVKDNMEYLQHD